MHNNVCFSSSMLASCPRTVTTMHINKCFSGAMLVSCFCKVTLSKMICISVEHREHLVPWSLATHCKSNQCFSKTCKCFVPRAHSCTLQIKSCFSGTPMLLSCPSTITLCKTICVSVAHYKNLTWVWEPMLSTGSEHQGRASISDPDQLKLWICLYFFIRYTKS